MKTANTVVLLCIVMTSLVSASFAQSAQPKGVRAKERLYRAAFDETYKRYPAPDAVLQQLRRIAPFAAKNSDACQTLNNQSAPVLGVIDPLQFGPLEVEPGPMFYQYYQDCVRSMVGDSFSYSGEATMQAVLGASGYQALLNMLDTRCKNPDGYVSSICSAAEKVKYGFRGELWAQAWKNYPEEFQTEIISSFILTLLGPEPVLRFNGYIGDTTAFGVPLRSKEELVQFLNQYVQSLQKDEPEISFMNVYAEIAIVLRLGPALKN